jgi:hypothetical protein
MPSPFFDLNKGYRTDYNQKLTKLNWKNEVSTKEIAMKKIFIFFTSPIFEFNYYQSPLNIVVGPMIQKDNNIQKLEVNEKNIGIINFFKNNKNHKIGNLKK